MKYKIIMFLFLIFAFPLVLSLPSDSDTYVVGSQAFFDIFFGHFIRFTILLLIFWVSYEKYSKRGDSEEEEEIFNSPENKQVNEEISEEEDFSKYHSLKIIKIYKDVTFEGLPEESRKIVDEYSVSFRVEMDENTASEIVKKIIEIVKLNQ